MCGRAGPGPLGPERLGQGENEIQRHCGIGPMKLGASGARPLSWEPSWCWAVKALCFPWTLRQPQHHSAPSQLCFDLKMPTWFPGISQTPPILPPRPSCCSMLGRRAVWRLLDCIKNSIQRPCKESHTSPYFRDKETEARRIFKATVLECGEARVESAASVLITCTFPPVLKVIYPYYE